jgi:hypothetical protein
VSLKRLTGSVVSRRGAYAKASPQCLDPFFGMRW